MVTFTMMLMVMVKMMMMMMNITTYYDNDNDDHQKECDQHRHSPWNHFGRDEKADLHKSEIRSWKTLKILLIKKNKLKI